MAVFLPGILVIIAVELWQTRVDAIDASNAAFDRSLLGTIRSVEMGVSTASGGLSVELPYRMFELFQLTASGNVFYRVATADGLVEIGSPDLPMPEDKPSLGTPVFYDADYLGEPVRVGILVRALDEAFGGGADKRLLIQVAESIKSRQAFSRSFIVRSAARDAVVISLIGVTLTFVLTLLLRPVTRLAENMAGRQPFDVRPIGERDLPRDIQALVDAMNFQLEKTEALMTRQRQFVDDASHQLRTPLAVLHAQVGYAIRQPNHRAAAQTLNSIRDQLESATRSTNQLLSMARTDAVVLQVEQFDLTELVREVGNRMLPLARIRHLDFGVEVSPGQCPCIGDRQLLVEALSNLAHNAITYTDLSGQVTLSAAIEDAYFCLAVVNPSSAIPQEVLANVGARFVKGEHSRGAGLGLSIARTIAEHHGGSLSLEHLADPARAVAILRWPARGCLA